MSKGPKAGQDFDLTLFSGTQGVEAQPAIEQQRSFGTIVKGMSVCGDDLAPSDANGVQIFGFTNGFPSRSVSPGATFPKLPCATSPLVSSPFFAASELLKYSSSV